MPRQPQPSARKQAPSGTGPGGKKTKTRDKRTKENTSKDEDDYRVTSLRLRRDIMERAKVLALRRLTTMGRIVEIAIDEYLTAQGLPRQRRTPS